MALDIYHALQLPAIQTWRPLILLPKVRTRYRNVTYVRKCVSMNRSECAIRVKSLRRSFMAGLSRVQTPTAHPEALAIPVTCYALILDSAFCCVPRYLNLPFLQLRTCSITVCVVGTTLLMGTLLTAFPSFFLWGLVPDDAPALAAQSGELTVRLAASLLFMFATSMAALADATCKDNLTKSSTYRSDPVPNYQTHNSACARYNSVFLVRILKLSCCFIAQNNLLFSSLVAGALHV